MTRAPQPPADVTVFYDGACPLCSAEIGLYRAQDRDGALCLVDVSRPEAALPPGVTQAEALARFHVRAADGRVLSGAAAFVAVWQSLPRWRWLARLARVPGMLWVMERGYRLFLPLRPAIVAVYRRLARKPA
ncbi:MAG: DUF393 domain-containing protein [Paracoccaceae bacterium]|nr:DUF393 domain-containing protein [Paracoccaceae bacterium]